MPLVLTSCTNRKRFAVARTLGAGSVPRGDLKTVATEWARRIAKADPVARSHDLYCGRGFRTAEEAALRVSTPLFVVSAGLGLVAPERHLPAYSLTVTPGGTDSVLARITHDCSPSEWWSLISTRSPYSTSIEDAARSNRGPILVALSASYLAMIAEELSALGRSTRARVRLFNLGGAEVLPPDLQAHVMPYDSRFDGPGSPLPGTRGDFAQRALWHFVTEVLPRNAKADAAEHASAVNRMLSGMKPHNMPVRQKLSDPEITKLIRRHWRDVDGQSSRMLRYLRDSLGIACEQGRFKDLFNAVRSELRMPA